MSSILKALKKLEREKSQQRDDHIDLARDIFRGGERRKGFDWLTLVVASALLLTVVAVILFVLRQIERREPGGEVAPQSPVSRSVSVPPPPVANESVVEELVDQRRPQLRPPEPVRRPATVRPATVRRYPPTVAAIPPKGPEAVVVEEVLPPPAAIPVPPPQPVPATSQIAPAPQDLVLTAIVFQPERESRIAVINDLPVMEGSLVGEFRVDEIQADRVILSRNGALYEVRTLD